MCHKADIAFEQHNRISNSDIAPGLFSICFYIHESNAEPVAKQHSAMVSTAIHHLRGISDIQSSVQSFHVLLLALCYITCNVTGPM